MKIASAKVVQFLAEDRVNSKGEERKAGFIKVGVSIEFDNGLTVTVAGKTHKGKGNRLFFSYIHRTFTRTMPQSVQRHRSGSMVTDIKNNPIWEEGKKFKGIPEAEFAKRFSPEYVKMVQDAILQAEIEFENEQAARRAA